MSRKEAKTRLDLIDPALIKRGWDRADIRVEETAKKVNIIQGRGMRRPVGRTNYVLRRPLVEGSEPVPLAILEAKREGLPATHGLQQGKGYRGGYLHHVPFVFFSNGNLFVEYDEKPVRRVTSDRSRSFRRLRNSRRATSHSAAFRTTRRRWRFSRSRTTKAASICVITRMPPSAPRRRKSSAKGRPGCRRACC